LRQQDESLRTSLPNRQNWCYKGALSKQARWSLAGKYTLIAVAALAALVVWYELIAPGIKVGQRYHLTNHNYQYAGPGATVFASKADLDAAVRAQAGNDLAGMLAASANAVLVPPGVEVLIVGYGDVESLHAYNVRLLGLYAGKSGWVPEAAIGP
jgi:hypothetical protein